LHQCLFGERYRGELKEIDDALISLLSRWPWPEQFDLLYGLVGIGVYALERLPRRSAKTMARLVVERLADCAEEPDGLAAWPTPPGERAFRPDGEFNLGLAHGAPGVIGFLGRAAAAGIAPRTTVPLLQKATTWLLARRLPAGRGTAYPGYCERTGVPGPPVRTAWCYGDPGVASGLLAAARGAENGGWRAEAIRIASGAARRPLEETRVVDAGLCHGSAGLGQIFNRLWQATGDPVMHDAAVGWFRRTLDFHRPGHGIGGFVAVTGPSISELREVADPGVLTGTAGIALALLAATTPIAPEWDRVLLVSIPSPPPGSGRLGKAHRPRKPRGKAAGAGR
jgi:hypothetical protein